MQTLNSPRNGVTGLTFSPDGDMLAGIGAQSLYCWTRSRGWDQSGLRHQGTIAAAAFHPSGRTLAYAALNPSLGNSAAPELFTGVRLYPLGDVPEFEPALLPLDPPRPRVPELWVRGLTFTGSGRTLLAALIERPFFRRMRTVIWRWHFVPSETGWRVTDEAPTRTETEGGSALVGESDLALAGTWGVRACSLLGGATGLHVPDVSGCQAVDLAPGCELLATADALRLAVWHLRSATPVCAVPIPSGSVPALAFSPAGDTLATATGPSVALRDAQTSVPRAEFDFGVGPVQSLAYAPDGFTLAVAGRKGLVVVDTE